LTELVEQLESERPDAAIAVAGDFNADTLEEPLQLLERSGLSDLLAEVPPAQRYSYAFQGSISLLDHVLANARLAARLESSGIWHVNADAPSWLDYRLDNPPELFRDDAVRSSDHDPVYVDVSYPLLDGLPAERRRPEGWHPKADKAWPASRPTGRPPG
jgi:predicted extracellular nuclease